MKKMFISVITLLALLSVPAYALDTESPSDVENFQGAAYDGSVLLTWDASTDDTAVDGYVVHYGLSPVVASGQLYDNADDVGNVTEYLVEGLDNDVEHYFSAIAYDADGNESISWAVEVAVTPDLAAGSYSDDVAPEVVEAEAVDKFTVSVEFSEAVVLLGVDPEDAFQIEDDDLLEPLIVTEVVMDEEDDTNKTVLVTTEEQTLDTTYTLTVTIDVEDESGNPIVSGTADTAIFSGSDLEPEVSGDVDAPVVVSAGADDSTHILGKFSEVIVLNIDPSENFVVVEEDDGTASLTVLGVEVLDDETMVRLTVSPMNEVAYVLTAVEVEDEAGNEVSVGQATILFDGFVEEEDDDDDDVVVELPAEATELIAEIVETAGRFGITFKWLGSVDEVSGQMQYLSQDEDFSEENLYESGPLDTDDTEHGYGNLEEGDYWFKLTQVDADGNETEGILKKVSLSSTGPGVVGLVLVSLGLGRLARRKN